MLLVIDSRYFDSVIVTSMRDDVHSDYGGETLEQLRDRYDNSFLITVTPDRIALLLKRYDKALCQPFEEISEERYYDLLNCVPPKRQRRCTTYAFVWATDTSRLCATYASVMRI